MRIILTKMSSLGDIVHTFPALTDAALHGYRFDWIVEEEFADIAAMHPAVDRVIPISLRRWRSGRMHNTYKEFMRFLRLLREQQYDMVIDAQGLLKSGIISALVRGKHRGGFSAGSAREGIASIFYDSKVKVDKNDHAIDRLRHLFGSLFSYKVEAGFNYGIENPNTGDNTCVLIHGSTWPSKEWPEVMWVRIGQLANESGMKVALPWQGDIERSRAERLAGQLDATLWGGLSIMDITERLSRSRLVIGVDSGLSHLSAGLGSSTVVIYGSTDLKLTGVRGRSAVGLSPAFSCSPCLKKVCNYSGSPRDWNNTNVSPACYSEVTPELVWRAADDLINEDRL